tara:strand:- start:123 stop:359 length:237 start_codon:yes stop_codon:yes gene_type:complete
MSPKIRAGEIINEFEQHSDSWVGSYLIIDEQPGNRECKVFCIYDGVAGTTLVNQLHLIRKGDIGDSLFYYWRGAKYAD